MPALAANNGRLQYIAFSRDASTRLSCVLRKVEHYWRMVESVLSYHKCSPNIVFTKWIAISLAISFSKSTMSIDLSRLETRIRSRAINRKIKPSVQSFLELLRIDSWHRLLKLQDVWILLAQLLLNSIFDISSILGSSSLRLVFCPIETFYRFLFALTHLWSCQHTYTIISSSIFLNFNELLKFSVNELIIQ